MESKKYIMKKYFSAFIVGLAMLFLSGCGEQYTEEELYQMCIDNYMERNPLDLSYQVEEKYETVEETYLAIIQLAKWDEEKDYGADDLFAYDNYRYDNTIIQIVKKGNLKWYELEKRFEEEEHNYLISLEKNRNTYFLQILNRSCVEIQENKEEIYSKFMSDGFMYTANAEIDRIDGDYKWMFITSSNIEFVRTMFYTLYPEEMYQGALECIYHPIAKDSVNRAKEFLTDIGDYEKYAADIAAVKEKLDKAEKSEYGNSQKKNTTKTNKGKTSDPYDVYDYYDPEDFYYDWEEDFDGYEDAEDYWNDAWD